ncbi:MAG: ribonucleoside-diphosphate reductase subunit alpha [bacterium]|nr:ribonucleoside-diphosphate reductase subunit alpha [bacterium]
MSADSNAEKRGKKMTLEKIKKRNGDIVVFSAEKIHVAIEKAMTAVRGNPHTEEVRELLAYVRGELEAWCGDERMPEVEKVQDLVEQALMEFKFFDVARAYIIYREQHHKIREEKKQEELKKISDKTLYVIKRDGRREVFNESKLRELFAGAAQGYEKDVDVDALVKQCKMAVHDGISTDEIEKVAILTTRSFIEREPAYDYVTARLFLAASIKKAAGKNFVPTSHNLVLGFTNDLDRVYRETFVKNLRRGVEIGRLDPALLQFDLEVLAKGIDMTRDNLFTYRGLQTLYDRYFLSDADDERRLELPQTFFMRVAMGLAQREADKNARALEFYDLISSMRYMPSTPTLFHSGTIHPQLSSCYLTTVEDDLGHIFKCLGDNAQLSKWSGGLGNDWSSLRGMGALIKKTNVESQGVIPFLKIANDVTVAINRSGKRRGATCAYLETWHYDIEDFLELRKNTGDDRRRTHDMNTANWIPDLFMKRVMQDESWTLFSPDETPDLHHKYGKAFEEAYVGYEKKAAEGKVHLFKKMRAKDLWRKMLTMLFETGHPWMTFKDPCNIRSPQDHVGVVHSSNLCTEITLNTSKEETAVCNLGSVNLARHIAHGALDEDMLARTVKAAMRMLDNVVDINFYPTEEAKHSNLRHRPVGLGIMGFQDALYMLGIRFDSDACVRFADESMEVISYHAILGSSELARERGAYATYKGSKWDRGIFPQDTLNLLEEERGIQIEVARTGRLDWAPVRESVKKYGMRNSNTMAIAPTATISNISGCFPCIEPIYKNLYVKSNMSGEFTVINPYLVEDLKKLGLWNTTMLEMFKYYDGNIQQIAAIPQRLKDLYKEVFEIDAEWLIKAAAYRGKWIDQSQSLNMFVRGTSGKQVSDMYLYAWKMGLKTTYYLRTLAASAIEKSTIDINKWKEFRENTLEESSVKVEKPKLQEAEAPKLKVCGIDDPTCEACQ